MGNDIQIAYVRVNDFINDFTWTMRSQATPIVAPIENTREGAHWWWAAENVHILRGTTETGYWIAKVDFIDDANPRTISASSSDQKHDNLFQWNLVQYWIRSENSGTIS